MALTNLYQGYFTEPLTGNQFWLIIQKEGAIEANNAITILAANLDHNGDDILTPIRSTELNISVLNSGVTSDDFYSDEDFQFYAKFYQVRENGLYLRKLLFGGYLQYSESSTAFNDLPGPINLTFTCGVGELKNTLLSTAFEESGYGFSGIKISLSKIIQACLVQTKQPSNDLQVYANFFCNEMLDSSYGPHDFLECNIHTGVWNESTTVYDCLNDIMSSFKCSLSLINGIWTVNSIADNYLTFTPSQAQGTLIDHLGVRTDANDLRAALTIGKGGDMLFVNADAFQSNVRAVKTIESSFGYVYPEVPIYNLDLKILGTLRNSYLVSGDTFSEYEATGFYASGLYGSDVDFWIEVVTDSDNFEKDRYLVIKSTIGAVQDAVYSSAYYINKGDTVKFNYQVRTKDSRVSGARTNVFYGIIDNPNSAVDNKVNYNSALAADGTWTATGSILKNYSDGEDSAIWSSIDVDATNAPNDGYLKILIGQFDSIGQQTYWKGLSVQITAQNTNSTKITGQKNTRTFTEERQQTMLDQTVIANSIRNAVSGSLLTDALSTHTSYTPGTPSTDFRTLTKKWHRHNFSLEEMQLGELLTGFMASYYGKKRHRIEATIQSKYIISFLDKFTINHFRNNIFVPISIKHNLTKGICSIIIQDIGNKDEVITNDYKFELEYE